MFLIRVIPFLKRLRSSTAYGVKVRAKIMLQIHFIAAMLRSLKTRACVSLIAAVGASQFRTENAEKSPKVYDIAVIGAGVVGLSVARECATKYGKSVIVIDKEDCVAAGISSGNSGIGCTGYDAPVGSLERLILRRSIQLHQNLYRSLGLSHNHVRKCGSLIVAWSTDELDKLKEVVRENVEAGDVSVEIISRDELRELEPNLSHDAVGAVLLPNEAIVEPVLVPIAHAESAIVHGVQFQLSSRVSSVDFDKKENLWRIQTLKSSDSSLGRSTNNGELSKYVKKSPSDQPATAVHAKVVINCAGLNGDVMEEHRKKNCPTSGKDSASNQQQQKEPFRIIPRKGQFVVFKPVDVPIASHIIEPVPTQFSKGVMIFRTVYGNVIVGPTAVDIESKEDRSTDATTVEALKAQGAKWFPYLKNAEVVGTYACLRPATQYRDFQISSYPQQQWICVAGIRSTGLSASSGIGEYVSELLTRDDKGELKVLPQPRQAYLDMIQRGPVVKGELDGLLGVSEVAANPLPRRNHPPMPPIPTLPNLAKQYCQSLKDAGLSASSGVGCVTINGHKYRVTHPISSFGMESCGLDK